MASTEYTVEPLDEQADDTAGRPGPNRVMLGVTLALLLGLGAFLFIKLIVQRSPIDTSYASHVHAMLVEPNGLLVMSDHNSIWTWQPASRTWHRDSAPFNRLTSLCLATLPGRIMLACSADPSTRAVSVPRGMWRSTDGGTRWRRIGVPDRMIQAAATDPGRPRSAVIVALADASDGGIGHGGIYRTMDGGKTWRRVETALGGEVIQAMAMSGAPTFRVFVATPDGFWVGNNNATRWKQVMGVNGQVVLAMAAEPASAQTLYAGTYDGLLVSTDSGGRWRSLVHGGSVTAIAPTSRSDDVYLVQRNHVVHILGGTRIGASGLPTGAPGALAADPSDPDRAYVAYSFPLRVFTTRNGGRSWTQIV